MELAMVGLGKMGFNMATRLLRHGHRVVAYARRSEVLEGIGKEGAVRVASLQDAVAKLGQSPRVVWLMVPAGNTVSEMIDAISPLLSEGDIVVDGGNSYYKDSIGRAEKLRDRGLRFLDVGTSGGIWGLKVGYCMMVGGEEDAFRCIEPAVRSLAPAGGYSHVGPSGAGHFVKMVHNGIEYGMLQAYAEGFELLESSSYNLDLGGVARLWNRGSVVRSWLLELAESALSADPGLRQVQGYVEDSGEGRWTVLEAVERSVPAPVITASLFSRFLSRQDDSFAAKVIAALRREFGGHGVRGA